MSQLRAFFGDQAADILMRYRGRDRLAGTIGVLNQRISQLSDQLAELEREFGPRVTEQEARVADSESGLVSLAQTRIVNKASRSACLADRQLWRRLGISLRRLFSSSTPSVADTKNEIDQVDQQLTTVDERIDYQETVAGKQRHALRKLNGPLVSLRYAVESLSLQRRNAIVESEEQVEVIRDAIRQIARNVSLGALIRKRESLPHEAQEQLIDDMLALKRVLLRIAAVQSCNEVLSTKAALEMPSASVTESVGKGMHSEESVVVAKVSVTGSGTTHVKKTRTVQDTVHDSGGGTSLNTRTETYWDKVSIQFDDLISVRAKISCTRWDSSTTANAISEHCVNRFNAAVILFRDENLAPLITSLLQQNLNSCKELLEVWELSESIRLGQWTRKSKTGSGRSASRKRQLDSRSIVNWATN